MTISARSFHLLIGFSVAFLANFPATAQQASESFRPFVLKAVKSIYDGRRGGGYDLHRRFTRDLHYGGDCCLKASRPLRPDGRNATMCVAAVAEVIVEALNEYGRQGDTSFSSKLPLSRWNGSTKTHVIPNLFMYAGSDSSGTAFALQRLGLGREKSFAQLQPGDFVNFNRLNHTGHAVVFLGFLGKGGQPTERFGANVIGFRYFSAQGMNRPDGGFGYRNAYLAGKCPAPRGRDDDCNIIGVTVRSDGTVVQTQRLFNSGEMFLPRNWRTAEALAELRQVVSRGFEAEGLTRGAGLEEAVEAVLTQPLQPDPARFADGSDD